MQQSVIAWSIDPYQHGREPEEGLSPLVFRVPPPGAHMKNAVQGIHASSG